MSTFQYVCQKHFEILFCSPKFCRPHISCTDQKGLDTCPLSSTLSKWESLSCPQSDTRHTHVFKFKSFNVMCNDINYYLYIRLRKMQGKILKIENINCKINSFYYIQN